MCPPREEGERERDPGLIRDAVAAARLGRRVDAPRVYVAVVNSAPPEDRRIGGLTTVLRGLYATASRDRGLSRRVLRPGDPVGTLVLVRELGRGGSGIVYEAYDRAWRRRVAVKLLDGSRRCVGMDDPLQREVDAITALAHPNIVEVLDSGLCAAGRYLVLELLRGSALSARLMRGALPTREALRISIEVARAMAHAHARGVIHRDLTPGNVFLCTHGPVKVLDFGISQVFGRRKVEGGTSAYMAPEQVRGAPEDERTDVFALGVMLFHMISGQLPFRPGAASARARRDFLRLELPSEPALASLVGRMLQDDPVKRPRDGAAVLTGLGALWRRGEVTPRVLDDVADTTVPRGRRAPPRRRSGRGTSEPDEATAVLEPATVDPEAHRDFLIGRQFRSRGATPDNLRRAIAAFERALSRDPHHAAAWAGLSDALNVEADHAASRAAQADLEERAIRAADRAVALGPSLPDGYRQRAILRRSRCDWAGARADLSRARRLGPGDPSTSREEGRLLATLGRTPQAIELLHEAIALDPLDARSWYFLGAVNAGSGDLVRARNAYHRAWDVAPDSVGAPFGLGVLDLLEGDPAAALGAFARAGDLGRALGTVLAEHDLRRPRRSAKVLAGLVARYASTSPCTVAKAHAWRGELGSAFALLDRALAQHDPALAIVPYDPLLRNVRLDARYRALRRAMNLPTKTRASAASVGHASAPSTSTPALTRRR